MVTQIREVLPGLLLLIAVALLVRKGAEPLLHRYWEWGITVLHLNYVLLAILCGLLLANTLGIPRWAAPGVRASALILKTGVILMGSLYSFAEIGTIGRASLILVATFVFLTVFLVLWLGRIFRVKPSLTGVLAAGCAICGVSAEIAAAPVVGATMSEVAYAIGVILGFGLVELFVFPTIGTLLHMTPFQFGAWRERGFSTPAKSWQWPSPLTPIPWTR